MYYNRWDSDGRERLVYGACILKENHVAIAGFCSFVVCRLERNTAQACEQGACGLEVTFPRQGSSTDLGETSAKRRGTIHPPG